MEKAKSRTANLERERNHTWECISALRQQKSLAQWLPTAIQNTNEDMN